MHRPTIVTALRMMLAGLLAGTVTPCAQPAELTPRTLRIASDPPGAEVMLIGGSAGRTPLTIGERDIYPNDYPDERAHLYGTVTLRRDGCETVVHRVTLDDVEQGLMLDLDCADGAARAAPTTVVEPPASAAAASATTAPAATGISGASGAARTAPAVPAGGESVPQRRLRQLQVLQELLDEGLISAADEQRIRRRVLTAP